MLQRTQCPAQDALKSRKTTKLTQYTKKTADREYWA